MSAAKMVADSTQDSSEGKKKKKKLKKSGKKVSLPEDEDSDLDLKKDLKPIGFYIKDGSKMIDEMFHAVKGASLQRALPELLKSVPLDELKVLCMEQLEVMSKKRIRRILAGEESANISSSGTEDDDSSEEETQDGKSHTSGAVEKKPDEGPIADSTSIHQDTSQAKKSEPESEQVPTNNEQPEKAADDFIPDVDIKQEPHSEPEEEYDDQRHSDDYDDDEDEDDDFDEEEDEEAEEEDPPEAYTSGSEDGELVKKDSSILKVDGSIEIKKEVMSDGENQDSNMVTKEDDSHMESDSNVDGATECTVDQNVEELEGDLLSSVEADGAGQSGSSVLPSIMMDQMELLELEMRARAIKAMLTSQEEDHEDG